MRRTKIQEGLLRRVMRAKLYECDELEEQLIRLALDDETVFGTLYDNAMRRARRFGESTAAFSVVSNSEGAPIVDNLLKLLQWFATNGPALIEIIELIVNMFGTVSTAVEVCEAESLYLE